MSALDLAVCRRYPKAHRVVTWMRKAVAGAVYRVSSTYLLQADRNPRFDIQLRLRRMGSWRGGAIRSL